MWKHDQTNMVPPLSKQLLKYKEEISTKQPRTVLKHSKRTYERNKEIFSANGKKKWSLFRRIHKWGFHLLKT